MIWTAPRALAIIEGPVEEMPSVNSRPRNLTRFWRTPALKGLSLLQADLTDQEFPPHVHDALVIAITEQGGAIVRTRGASQAADQARVLVFNPGEPHSGDMGGSPLWRYRGLYFEQCALDRLRDDLNAAGHAYFRDTAVIDIELARNLLDMHRALERGEADAFHAEETIAQTMGLLYARHGDARPDAPPATRDRDIIKRASAHLRARFDETVRLEDVASAVGLTPFQLISLFKRELGLTPYALLTQIRLNVACSMLKRGSAIADCASACGFYDQAALTKHFRARFAITPAQFAAGADRPA
jgi:AraC-like DNA-binding protein